MIKTSIAARSAVASSVRYSIRKLEPSFRTSRSTKILAEISSMRVTIPNFSRLPRRSNLAQVDPARVAKTRSIEAIDDLLLIGRRYARRYLQTEMHVAPFFPGVATETCRRAS